MEDINKDIRKNGASNGLILGIVVLIIGILFVYLMANWASIWAILGVTVLSFIVYVLLGVFFSIDLRKKIGGFWNFRQAVSGIFIMFFVAYILSSAGNYLFVKFVEPDITNKIKANVVESTSLMMANQGVEQAKIDEQTAKIEKDFDDRANPTFGKTVQGILISIIVVFVCALIFGAIFKKERPIFIDAADE